MKNHLLYFMLLLLLQSSCVNTPTEADIEGYRKEILEAEKAFAKMASDKGTAEAFAYFAAEDAVLLRGTSLLYGKEEIMENFANQPYTDIKLDWKPDFIDVSESGDLGYTYGKFSFSAVDSSGNPVESTGIFHTVWKRQEDGSWKYVWD